MQGIRVVVVLEIILLTNGNQNCNAEELYVKHVKYSADVYEFLAGKNKGNFVVSPLSAEILLSLIAEGARGDALSELTDYLGVSSDRYDVILRIVKSLNQSTCDYQIVSVNKVYISNNYEIEATFKNISLLIYNTTVETVDFRKAHEVSKVINQWVEHQTNHKIHNLIHSNELDAATIILVNVIYFSASWARPFRYKHTSPAKFYVSNGGQKEVHMMEMSRHIAKFWHSKELEVKFLELPFTTENITMIFILPDAKHGLSSMKGTIENYINHKQFSKRKVHIKLPKFSTQITLDLVSFLKEKGVKSLFNSSADLSGISLQKGLSVSSLRQKVFINVTEKGVEAASATYGIMNKMLQTAKMPEEIEEFIADHPFLFFLREKQNNMIVFIGQFVG